MAAPSSRGLVKLLLLGAFVAGAVLVFRFTSAGDYVAPARVRAVIEELDPITSRLTYIAVYVLGAVLLLPGVLFSFVGAALFGVWEGTLYTWIGAVIGATLAFWLAKALGRDFIESLLGGRLQALDERLRQHGFTGLLILRLVPLFPFNGLNFGCGLTSIRPRDYVLATAIGILPGTFVYQFMFVRLQEKLLKEEGITWEDWLDPTLGLALGLFVLFIVAGKILSNMLNKAVEDRGGQDGG